MSPARANRIRQLKLIIDLSEDMMKDKETTDELRVMLIDLIRNSRSEMEFLQKPPN
jgi:hypothetical protein